jgi:enediyne biosynthesis protein E5
MLVAIADHILRLYFRDEHSFYHSLFFVGPITNLIEIWWTSRKHKAPPAAVAASS